MLSKRTKFSCSWVLENHVGFIRILFVFYIKDLWNTPFTIFLGLRFILNGCFIRILFVFYIKDLWNTPLTIF